MNVFGIFRNSQLSLQSSPKGQITAEPLPGTTNSILTSFPVCQEVSAEELLRDHDQETKEHKKVYTQQKE
jgi:hypothetical protein